MSFIKSYGIALPHFRIDDRLLHPKGRKGMMKSICFPDEDIITLAFESAVNCINNSNQNIEAVFFATSTPVFYKRYHASFLADLLNLPQKILALDFTGTSRCASDALLIADQFLRSDKYKNILVIAADVYFPPIGKELTIPFGHAACSLLLSNEEGIAEITSASSFSAAVSESYKYKGGDIMLDPRFTRSIGFKTNISSSLKKVVSKTKSYDAVILNSLYTKMAGRIFAKAGFEEKQFSKDVLISEIGNTGSTHALLLLVNELEHDKKSILMADYTNGSNFFEIKANKAVQQKALQQKMKKIKPIRSYQDYLLIRKTGNFNSLKYESKEIFSSEMMQEREKGTLLYLKALQCNSCGTIYYIKSKWCKKCREIGFSEKQLSRKGSVYSFTREHYFPTSFPPISMVVIDLEGGGRITVQQTDDMYAEEHALLNIGDKVELVLRKMIENDVRPEYFWKAIKI